MGQEAFVDALLAGFAPAGEPFYVETIERPARGEMRAMEDAARKEAQSDVRRADREQMYRYAGWWIDAMSSGRDPLRERMVLFWHGYFTSAWRDVKSSEAMIRQNELFRERGLGRFGDLLHAIVRDPALLEYLDNDQNRKGNPNENLARELMELFTLGVGNYSEDDVKEAARALTGWQTRGGEAYFNRRQHDAGKKTILGVTQSFDADMLVELLLDQPACPAWVARKLLVHFEGRDPSPQRLADYARFLEQRDYDVQAFLRRLFLDPAFYGADVVGNRIAGPIEYMVGSSQRLGIEPPPVLLWLAAGQLGQRLFDPPNVKGWEGGATWITTSTLMQRGNLAGMLLGVVRIEDVLRDEPLETDPSLEESETGEAPMESGEGDEMEPSGVERGPAVKRGKRPALPKLGPEAGAMRRMLGDGYRPGIHLTARMQRAGASADAQIVDTLASELLPVPLSAESRAALTSFLAAERAERSLDDGELLANPRTSEDVLRRLAHLILSLPEAQLS